MEQKDGLTAHERKEFKKQHRQEQREQERHEFASQRSKSRAKRYAVIAFVVILVSTIVAVVVAKISSAPGQYDDFAKCLTEKGVVMYGAIEWCTYTQEQAKMFGNSFKYVDYKDYSAKAGIKITPTWLINGKLYEKVQSFERLSELSGCKY